MELDITSCYLKDTESLELDITSYYGGQGTQELDITCYYLKDRKPLELDITSYYLEDREPRNWILPVTMDYREPRNWIILVTIWGTGNPGTGYYKLLPEGQGTLGTGYN